MTVRASCGTQSAAVTPGQRYPAIRHGGAARPWRGLVDRVRFAGNEWDTELDDGDLFELSSTDGERSA